VRKTRRPGTPPLLSLVSYSWCPDRAATDAVLVACRYCSSLAHLLVILASLGPRKEDEKVEVRRLFSPFFLFGVASLSSSCN